MSEARLGHASPSEGEFQKVSQVLWDPWWSQSPPIGFARSVTPLLHLHWGLCGHHGPEEQNLHQKGAALPWYFPLEWLLVFES